MWKLSATGCFGESEKTTENWISIFKCVALYRKVTSPPADFGLKRCVYIIQYDICSFYKHAPKVPLSTRAVILACTLRRANPLCELLGIQVKQWLCKVYSSDVWKEDGSGVLFFCNSYLKQEVKYTELGYSEISQIPRGFFFVVVVLLLISKYCSSYYQVLI